MLEDECRWIVSTLSVGTCDIGITNQGVGLPAVLMLHRRFDLGIAKC